jgi:sec-independent protein translocase protein TatA
MFGNLGMSEILMVLVIVLLVFGAKRLPEIGSSFGKGIREFKRSMKEVTDEIDRPEPPSEPRRLTPPDERRQN